MIAEPYESVCKSKSEVMRLKAEADNPKNSDSSSSGISPITSQATQETTT